MSGNGPRNFGPGQTIDGTATFTSYPIARGFRVSDDYFGTFTAPDVGQNSYMGSRADSGNFGWLEVTWTSATHQFDILSGAYERVPNTPILAGQSVPEPSTVALGGVGALVCGGAALRRWRKQKRA